MNKYSTAELAKLIGISKNTLIRWENRGLIPVSDRDGRNWRVWSKAHLHAVLDYKNSLEKVNSNTKQVLRISVIGYGNQAEVWARNFKDSGINVKILLRENSNSISKAMNAGFEVLNITEGLKEGEIFCLLIPDEEHTKFFNSYNKYINKNKLFIFAHGYSVHYLNVFINARKALLAPKAIASIVRSKYLNKQFVLSAYFCESNKDEVIIKQVANALKFKPLIKSSFKEETISDLYTEQVLLCGALPYFILQTFNKLTTNAFNKNIVFQETINELDYILQVIKEVGINDFFKKISPVAFNGAMEFINKLENNTELNMLFDEIFSNIRNKKFISNNLNRDKDLEKIKKISSSFDKTLNLFKELKE